MVKGVYRRVVVVRPEDGTAFEQAIFIVKDGGGQDVMREACQVAERYLRQSGPMTKKWKRRYTLNQLILAATGGAGLVAFVWFCTMLVL